MPVANPISLSQDVDGVHLGRYDLATGQNFNRGFFDHAAALAEQVKDRLGADPADNVAVIRCEWAARPGYRAAAAQRARHSAPAAEVARASGRIVLDLHSADEARGSLGRIGGSERGVSPD
jgi:hypothetical protein